MRCAWAGAKHGVCQGVRNGLCKEGWVMAHRVDTLMRLATLRKLSCTVLRYGITSHGTVCSAIMRHDGLHMLRFMRDDSRLVEGVAKGGRG